MLCTRCHILKHFTCMLSTSSIYFSCHQTFPLLETAAWMIGCSIITEAKRLVSLPTALSFSTGAVSWWLGAMLGIWTLLIVIIRTITIDWRLSLWGFSIIKTWLTVWFTCWSNWKCMMHSWSYGLYNKGVCDLTTVMMCLKYCWCAGGKCCHNIELSLWFLVAEIWVWVVFVFILCLWSKFGV